MNRKQVFAIGDVRHLVLHCVGSVDCVPFSAWATTTGDPGLVDSRLCTPCSSCSDLALCGAGASALVECFCERARRSLLSIGSLHSGGFGFAGLGKLGPDARISIREEINSGNLLLGMPLNQHCQFCGRWAVSVGDVLQMPNAGFALHGELLALGGRQRKKKWFEVHARISPRGVIRCQHLLVTFAV